MRGQGSIILLSLLVPSINYTSPYFKKYFYDAPLTNCQGKGLGHFLMEKTSCLLKEFVEVNRNFVSLDTVKVFTATIPPYIMSRKIENKLHRKFYDECRHKDRHQMPESFRRAVESGGDLGILALTSLAIFSSDEKVRLTARIFGIGAFSGLIFKDLIKSITKSKGAIRPYCQRYQPERTFGGFPSGHMIEASYMATVWGLQYGWRAGVPLGIFAALMFATLVNSNRHFASQVVAGAGVGIAYGFAAHRLIEQKWAERCSLRLCSNGFDKPEVQLSYRF